MTEPADHPTDQQDGATGAAPPPPEPMKGYPPEAAPATDDGTEPVTVPGEQTDPERRLEVFPEDEQPGDG